MGFQIIFWWTQCSLLEVIYFKSINLPICILFLLVIIRYACKCNHVSWSQTLLFSLWYDCTRHHNLLHLARTGDFCTFEFNTTRFMCCSSCWAQVHNMFQGFKPSVASRLWKTFSDVLFDHFAVTQLPVTNDQQPVMEHLLSCWPLDGSEALYQKDTSPLCVCCCHCWLVLSYLSSDPSFLL